MKLIGCCCAGICNA